MNNAKHAWSQKIAVKTPDHKTETNQREPENKGSEIENFRYPNIILSFKEKLFLEILIFSILATE